MSRTAAPVMPAEDDPDVGEEAVYEAVWIESTGHPAGAVLVAMGHHCGYCTTVTVLTPEEAESLIEELRFAIAEARAVGAGRATGQEGSA